MGSSPGVGGGVWRWDCVGSHHTFCRETFRAGSLFLLEDFTQAMCSFLQRKKGKRVKNVISGSSLLVKHL